jgi:hypothetical protein
VAMVRFALTNIDVGRRCGHESVVSFRGGA